MQKLKNKALKLAKILQQAIILCQQKHCVQHASGLAFNTALSMVPLLIICSWVITNIPGLQDHVVVVQDFLLTHLINTSSTVVKNTIGLLLQQSGTIPKFEIGLIMVVIWLLWQNIETVFNHLFSSKASKYAWLKSLLMATMLLLIPAILAIGFAISAILEADLPIIEQLNLTVSMPIETFATGFGISLLFLLFKWMPNYFIAKKQAFVVSCVVYLLLELANNGLTWYFNKYQLYYLIYGSYAAVPIFLLWLFVAWLIILFGASLIKVLN